MNTYELRLLYGMALNKNFDYAHLIFDQLVSLVSCKTRTSYAAFPRFLALALSFESMEYTSATDVSCSFTTLSPKIFGTSAPSADDASMPSCMTGWITSPYQGECLHRSTHPVLQPVVLANPEESTSSESLSSVSSTSSSGSQSSSNQEVSPSKSSSNSSSSAEVSSDSSSDSSDPGNDDMVVCETVPYSPQPDLQVFPSPVRGSGHVHFASPEPEPEQIGQPKTQ
ncbi:hypothetical protein L2E82_31169 [Cichorium intybus]|uniref:Uncharacterized protein n=1 Tax=Cichorium intybus TaxID=13427 RepID=A0ACB9D2L3_CICIN|nr:hypothetical protein L2E82_31169 [Cichorium intybus]